MLQKLVPEAIDEQVSAGRERAVQVAVYSGGELIVDAVAGPVTSSSLFSTWSMSVHRSASCCADRSVRRSGSTATCGSACPRRRATASCRCRRAPAGSLGYADPATGTAVAYCKNLQTMDFATATEIVELVNH